MRLMQRNGEELQPTLARLRPAFVNREFELAEAVVEFLDDKLLLSRTPASICEMSPQGTSTDFRPCE